MQKKNYFLAGIRSLMIGAVIITTQTLPVQSIAPPKQLQNANPTQPSLKQSEGYLFRGGLSQCPTFENPGENSIILSIADIFYREATRTVRVINVTERLEQLARQLNNNQLTRTERDMIEREIDNERSLNVTLVALREEYEIKPKSKIRILNPYNLVTCSRVLLNPNPPPITQLPPSRRCYVGWFVSSREYVLQCDQ